MRTLQNFIQGTVKVLIEPEAGPKYKEGAAMNQVTSESLS
jgi:hypothetical protein